MARISRVVVPGFPYHVTHRGNRRTSVFLSDDDRHRYLALLAEQAGRHGLDLWAWWLMTNHVHLIVVPRREDSMALALGRAHRQHARRQTLSGRPCGNPDFVKNLELRLGRILNSPPMGRPRRATAPESLIEDLFG